MLPRVRVSVRVRVRVRVGVKVRVKVRIRLRVKVRVRFRVGGPVYCSRGEKSKPVNIKEFADILLNFAINNTIMHPL